MKIIHGLCAISLAASVPALSAWAQSSTIDPPKQTTRMPACAASNTESVHTFYLHNITRESEANEVYTALRNMLPPDAKSYLVPSENTILICAGPEQITLAQRLINDLDRPIKNYRLTYTLTEMEGGKQVSTDHLSMVLAPGQSTTLKRGSKVPVATGTFAPKGETASSSPSIQTQYTYLDVGMNLQATLSSMENGLSLKTSVERSSVAAEPSGVGPQDPIVRQVSLKTDSLAPLGKPLMLGSVDIPDSTRHLEIEVKVEEVP